MQIHAHETHEKHGHDAHETMRKRGDRNGSLRRGLTPSVNPQAFKSPRAAARRVCSDRQPNQASGHHVHPRDGGSLTPIPDIAGPDLYESTTSPFRVTI